MRMPPQAAYGQDGRAVDSEDLLERLQRKVDEAAQALKTA
jgi:hypothetical protein